MRILFGCALAAMSVGSAAVVERCWTFDGDALGKVPKGLSVAVGDWKVAAEAEGNGRVLEQAARNANPVFNLVLADEPSAKDVDLSVRLQARSGRLDQGGGLVWRAKDPNNYYVARFNHLEDNFRVYKVIAGVRSRHLQSVRVAHRDDWMSLRVVMRGDRIEGYLNGEKYLDVRDRTFTEAGKIGLWSKSDARTWFDDLRLVAD